MREPFKEKEADKRYGTIFETLPDELYVVEELDGYLARE